MKMDNLLEDFKKVLVMYRLKEVYRACHVLDRNESTAEHTWGCMILADYFINKMKIQLDRERVMDILLYHDLVEVESGDTYAHDKEAQKTKNEKEKKGLERLKNKIPKELKEKYIALYGEYKKCETPEAKFANAIDKLDPIIHSLEKNNSWSSWNLSEKDIRECKEKHLEFSDDFMKILDDLLEYLKKNKFIRSN